MKKIQISQGRFIIVDDEDYEYLMQWKWHYHNGGYAARCIRNKGNKKTILMHREILGLKKGEIGDHINHNGLDNRRENLRKCTYSQNNMNRSKNKLSNGIYKGITLHKPSKLWTAKIKHNSKTKSLGYFKTQKDAAKAYNKAAKNMFGAFAVLNNV